MLVLKAKPECAGEDGGELPATDQGIDEPIGIRREGAATAEWQVIDAVGGKEMSDVEVRRAAANTKVGGIAHQAADNGIGNAGNVVNGARESVVKVKLQSAREIVFQVDQQAVVAGRAEVADVGVGGELSGEAAVVGDEAVAVQSLKRVRQIAFDDQVSEEIGDKLGAIGLRETRYERGAVSRR